MKRLLLFFFFVFPGIISAQFFPSGHVAATCEANFQQITTGEMKTISQLKLNSCKTYYIRGDSLKPDSVLTLEVHYDSLGKITRYYDSSIGGTQTRMNTIDPSTGKLLGYTLKEDGMYAVYNYDSAGNLSEFSYYWRDSSFKERYFMEYDEQRRCVKETYYNHDGSVRTGIFQYGKNELEIKYREVAFTGVIIFHNQKYTYDKQGRLTECVTIYPKDKNPVYEFIYWEYNARGQVAESQWLDRDGKLKQKEAYFYNANGLLVKKQVYFPGSNRTSVYHYYWN